MELKQSNLRIFNHLVTNHLCCGYTYVKMNQQQGAVIDLMNKILDIDADNLEACFIKGLAYVSLGDFQRAAMTLGEIRENLECHRKISPN